MKRAAGKLCIGMLSIGVGLTGCGPTPAPAPHSPPPPSAKPASAALSDRPITASAAPGSSLGDSDIIARVGTQVITKDDLLASMIEAHGLNFLLHIVQLHLARQAAAQQHVVVTADDFKQERELTFQRMFKESDDALKQRLKEATDKGDNDAVEKIKAELNVDRESLLDQYLVQQFAQSHKAATRQEFDLALQTNTYLRKIAEASPQLKNAVNDEMVRKAFNVRFGEKVVCRHIQAGNAAALQVAKARIDAGENFGEVAAALSTNKHTAPVGGTITPFTRNATNVPQIFRDTAFALKAGEVSDPVFADGAFHLIKVENFIAPRIVKFEDVRDSIRAELNDQVLQAAVGQLREKLAAQTMANLQIENPTLKAQFDKKREEGKVRQTQMDEAMKRDRAAADAGADGAAQVQPDLAQPGAAPIDAAPTTRKAKPLATSKPSTGAPVLKNPATRPAAGK